VDINFLQSDLIAKLRRRFGSIALFFWNASIGNSIGVVWRPKMFLVKSLSILQARDKLTIESIDNNSINSTLGVINNIPEIVSEMIYLSQGLISNAKFN
jgi:hypothetical protein